MSHTAHDDAQLGRAIAPASQLLEVVQTLARMPVAARPQPMIPVFAIEEVPGVAHGS